MNARDARPATRPLVALFGFYRYGNFGDDLMAAIVSRHLARNYSVRVFGPSIQNGDTWIPGTESIEELLTGADFVVYGGGGAFLKQREGRPPLPFDDELSKFCVAVERLRLPVHLVSVGGDGSPPPQLSAARQHLLSISTSGTFRNAEDQSLLDAVHGSTHVYDDLVWVTPQYFGEGTPSNNPDNSSGTLVVAVDGHLYRSRAVRFYFRALRAWCRLIRTNTEIRVLWQHQRPLPKGFPQDAIVYRDLDEFVRAIAGTDLVITSRLHLGMVAMSYGRTVVGLRPSPKQVLVFERFRRSHLLFRSLRDILRLARIIGGPQSAREFVVGNRYTDGDERAALAVQHLDELDRVLQESSGGISGDPTP